MAGPSTDTIALVCAQLTQAYVSKANPNYRFSKEDILNTYNEFIGMLEEQYAQPSAGGYNLNKMVE